jgi:hypothetical protein
MTPAINKKATAHRGGPMLDFIVDIIGQLILAVVGGATQWREDHLLAKKIPDRATPVR